MAPPALNRTAAEILRLLEGNSAACPICSFVSDAMRQHVDKLFYERVTDIPTREAIRKARGFCRPHALLVSEHADALGTAIILHDVLINELRDLDAGRLDRPPGVARGLSRFFEGAQVRAGYRVPGTGHPLGGVGWGGPPCPLCETECDIERMAVDDLLSAFHDPPFRKLFTASAGLCLPHFHLAYERCKDLDSWKIVLETQRGALAVLADQLAELARTYDYRSHGEPRGDESDSWRRALDMTSRRPQ